MRFNPICRILIPIGLLFPTVNGRIGQQKAREMVDGGCGPSNGNLVCSAGYCCSQWGFCGTTSAYCDSGCQVGYGHCNSLVSPSPTRAASSSSATPSRSAGATPTRSSSPMALPPNGMCGPTNGGYVCPPGYCCSQYGYCGTRAEYCTACQAGYGYCPGVSSSSSPSKAPGASVSRSPSRANSPTPSASKSQIRAITPSQSASPLFMPPNGMCGPTNGGYTCPSGYCCSQYGYCGTSTEYCGAGCQLGYGFCATSQTSATANPTTGAPARSPSSTKTAGAAPTLQIVSQCVVPGTVAITFDDGPWLYNTDIVNAFNAAGGKVTFFVNGNNYGCIYNFASQISQAVASGHQIASHTWSHPDVTTLPLHAQQQQLSLLDAALQKILGYSPTYFRPPYGRYNADSVRAAAATGYKYGVSWGLDSGDWGFLPMAEQQAVYNSAGRDKSHIALNHETIPSTASALVPFIINWAKSRNLRMVTVGECLGDPKTNWYKNYGSPSTPDGTWVC